MNDCSNGRRVSFLIEGDDVVSCEVCLEPFQPLNRPPKILPCGHNFCDQCLFSLCCHHQYYLLDSIKCPTCRASFPANAAVEAPTNWDLCKILENVQKGRETNVTVIHVPDPSERVPPSSTSSTSRGRFCFTRTSSKSLKVRCSDCSRELSTKILNKAVRYCAECNCQDLAVFTCLECCVNKHNGHALLSLSQLQAAQLKTLRELRELRSRLLETLPSSYFESGIRGETGGSKTEWDEQRESLSELDSALKVVESANVLCPKKLSEILNEQLQLYSRLITSRSASHEASADNGKKAKASLGSHRPYTFSRFSSLHSVHSLNLLIPFLPKCALSKELSVLLQNLSSSQPAEQRCEAFVKAATIITNILYEDIPVKHLPMFANAVLQCFCQANLLSKGKLQHTRRCSRKIIWKTIQLAYNELMRHAAKNFLSYELERIAILGDLAYVCRIFADVCDQATVTICMIEAARARVCDDKLPEEERQKSTERLKEIDDHLWECRRLQKLQDLRTNRKQKSRKLKWLWRLVFRQAKLRGHN